MGALDPRQGQDPRDAALVRRQAYRLPALPRRSVTVRRRDRHHRPVGRQRRPPRQSGRHAAAAGVQRRARMGARGRARPHRRDARVVHGEGERTGREDHVPRGLPDRGGPLDPGGRDQARPGQLRRRAPLEHEPVPRGRGLERLPQRVRGRQGTRHLPGGLRPPAAQRRAHHVQRALPLARRGDQEPLARRLLALPQGNEAEVRGAHDEGRPERQHRHPGRRP